VSDTRATKRLAAAAVFLACAAPMAAIGVDALRGALGANPVEAILNRLGFWALVLLVLSLAPTPLKIVFGWTEPARFRRMVGLFAFTYAALHLATYVGLDQFFDLPAIVADAVKRRFITVGLLGFVLLVPLALTSTDGWVRRLGYSRWKQLHRLSYVAAVCGVVHFVWRVKADLLVPLLFAAALAVLFAVRVVHAARRRARTPRAPAFERAAPDEIRRA
jgi:methionine sulfoxide reductase heme-binding subunit